MGQKYIRANVFLDDIELAKKPSKYSPRGTIEKTRKYIRWCLDKKQTPFIEQLALKLGVSEVTVRVWAKDETKPEFTEWFNILRTIQKLDLTRKSLAGDYQTNVAKLILSAEHGVVETVRKEVGGIDGKPIEMEQTLSPEARKAYSDEITRIFEKIYSKPNGK